MNNIANHTIESTKKAPIGFTVSLKGRALRLLSGREYSRAELANKLEAYETTPGELCKVLDELQAKDFINEQRVLESVLYRRSAKLGAARIKQELESKGLDASAILHAVDLLKSTELDRARAVWCKKFGTAPHSASERAKQMRFLQSRGFGAEVIYKVVGSTGEED